MERGSDRLLGKRPFAGQAHDAFTDTVSVQGNVAVAVAVAVVHIGSRP